jgi:hypothetical protein
MKIGHIVLLFLGVLVIVLLSVLLYRACNYFQTQQVQAFSLIPDNASLIIKGKRAEDILVFDKEKPCFLSFLVSEKQRKRIDYLLEILSHNNCKQLAKNASLYLSLHHDAGEEWAIILETKRDYNTVLLDFIDSLRAGFYKKSFVYKNNRIYAFTINRETLYVNHHNGLLLLTYSENLMRQAINKFVQNNDAIRLAINAMPAQRDERAKIHIFVQYQYFIPCLKNKIRKMGGDAAELDMFKACQWSVFELNMKKENILLSGYTKIDASNNQSKLLIHNNNSLDVIKFLPYSANRVFSIKAKQAADWEKMKHIVHPNEDFFALMYPTQIVTFDIENDTAVFHYLLIKSENISEASFHLYNSLQSSFEDNHYILDTFYIGSQLVGCVDLSNFVFTKLGICNQLPHLKYYTLTDNYLIFTDKKEGILTCIDQLRCNKPLYKSIEYQSSQHYFTREANLFYYCNLRNKKMNFQLLRMQLYAQTDSVLLMDVLLK